MEEGPAFPLPAAVATYYDHPRRRNGRGHWVCTHGRPGFCHLCASLKSRADAAYRRAIAETEVRT